jgi:hypothetical protein
MEKCTNHSPLSKCKEALINLKSNFKTANDLLKLPRPQVDTEVPWLRVN